MPYIKPADVLSPKAHRSLIDVLLTGAKGIALMHWVFGTGTPYRLPMERDKRQSARQSSKSGLPIWTMLDLEIHKQIIEQLPPEKLAMARGFLGIKLMLEGPTLEGTSGDLVFYDFFQNPPVLVKLSCNALRDVVQRPEISDWECQLLSMRHEAILTAVAAVLLEKGESLLRQDRRFRIIELQPKQLQKVANQFSTDVLAMAAAAHWSK